MAGPSFRTALLVLAVTGCSLPRDADGTLDRVRGGTMRIGVVDNPPWVIDSGGTVGGIEGMVVQQLARQLGATPLWVRRPESELIGALHKRELDLLIGGLTSDLPLQQQVAFTRPYYSDTTVIGAAPGERLKDVNGDTVAVELGSPIAADLKKKGAVPMLVPRLDSTHRLVAAPLWKLTSLGHESTGIVLRQEKHVMAAPLGENAWLVRIEQIIHADRSTIPVLLRKSAS